MQNEIFGIFKLVYKNKINLFFNNLEKQDWIVDFKIEN